MCSWFVLRGESHGRGGELDGSIPAHDPDLISSPGLPINAVTSYDVCGMRLGEELKGLVVQHVGV